MEAKMPRAHEVIMRLCPKDFISFDTDPGWRLQLPG